MSQPHFCDSYYQMYLSATLGNINKDNLCSEELTIEGPGPTCLILST